LKQGVNFAFPDPADVWIIGVVDSEIVPYYGSPPANHPDHFRGDTIPNLGLKNRIKQGEAGNKIEGLIIKG
jgi:hypothetical protein